MSDAIITSLKIIWDAEIWGVLTHPLTAFIDNEDMTLPQLVGSRCHQQNVVILNVKQILTIPTYRTFIIVQESMAQLFRLQTYFLVPTNTNRYRCSCGHTKATTCD